jgi:hypothetical protein
VRRGRQGLALIAGALVGAVGVTAASASTTTPVPPTSVASYGHTGDLVVFASAAPQRTIYVAGSHADGGLKYTPVFERLRRNGTVMWRRELPPPSGAEYEQVRSVTTDPRDGGLLSILTRTTRTPASAVGVLVHISPDGETTLVRKVQPDGATPRGGFAAGGVAASGKRLIVSGVGTFGGTTTTGVRAVVRTYDGTSPVATRLLGSAVTATPPSIAPNGDVMVAYTSQGILRAARLRADLSAVWDVQVAGPSSGALGALSIGVTHDGATAFVSGLGGASDIYALQMSNGSSLGTAPVHGQAFRIVPSRRGALLVGSISDQPFLGNTPQGGDDGFVAEVRSNNTLVWGDVRADASSDSYRDIVIDRDSAYIAGATLAANDNTKAQDFLATYPLNLYIQRG